MEIPIAAIGKMLESYHQMGYFETNSLSQSIEQMLQDEGTTIGIALQASTMSAEEQELFEAIWKEIWDTLK